MPKHSHVRDAVALMLLAERKRRKITQKELANRLGWDANSLWKLERFERGVQVTELYEFAIALGIEPSKLFADAVATIEAEISKSK
ncbi:helix-turn-helix domain-containing protein [Kordiimonas laminariae]|uniref:helix-turn-helix domain-containing protein n=1 Tax=Kordiimonas laminariae TaxID=2917717 RepID=UPI001FF12A47|nr:helix-turn-helix transcriptional regulator [Kordiimonas laminariae]MCK0071206.1 helix-turn-helix domain-containing protein [Kordiimonas laminariae]